MVRAIYWAQRGSLFISVWGFVNYCNHEWSFRACRQPCLLWLSLRSSCLQWDGCIYWCSFLLILCQLSNFLVGHWGLPDCCVTSDEGGGAVTEFHQPFSGKTWVMFCDAFPVAPPTRLNMPCHGRRSTLIDDYFYCRPLCLWSFNSVTSSAKRAAWTSCWRFQKYTTICWPTVWEW